MKIRSTVLSKMMLRSAIVLTLSILAVEYISYNRTSEQIIALTEERQRHQTDTYAERFDRIIAAAKVDIKTLASLPSLTDFRQNRQYGLMEEAKRQLENVADFALNLYQRNPAYVSIQIFDRDKKAQLSVIDGHPTIHNIAEPDLFRPNPPIVAAQLQSQLGLVQSTQKPHLIFSYPLTEPESAGGSLVVKFDLNLMFKDLRQERISKTGHFSVFTADGLVIEDSLVSPLKELASLRPVLSSKLQEIEQRGSLTYEEEDGKSYLLALATMKQQNWLIVSLVSENELLADLNATRNLIVQLVILAVVLEFFAVYLFTRHLISNPIEKLLAGTRSIEQGNYNPNIDINAKDEFGALKSAFLQMTQSLSNLIGELKEEVAKRKEVEEELRKSQTSLEKRVRERTYDLRKEVRMRKAAEEAAHENELKFRDFAMISTDWIWEMGPDLKFTYISDDFFELTGWERGDILGKSRWEMVSQEVLEMDPGGWRGHKEDMENHRDFRNFEYSSEVSSGEIHYFQVSGKALFDDDGDFLGYRGVARDVTQRRRTQLMLQRNEERLRKILEASPVGVAISDEKEGKVLFTNSRNAEMHGLTATELVGSSVTDFYVDPEQREQLLQQMEQEGIVRNAEVLFKRKDGSTFWSLLSLAPINYGNASVILAWNYDISALKYLELELKEAKEASDLANSAKSHFLANMSHELRTPLNAIIGFSDMLRLRIHGSLDHEQYAEYPDLIHESGKHLLDLINDILDLSKIEAGKLDLYLEPVDIHGVAEEIGRQIAQLAKSNGNQFNLVCDKKVGELVTDEVRLKQVLLNVLSNACKFTEKGSVSLQVSRENSGPAGEIVFVIKDTGKGMDRKTLDHIFEEFVQSDEDSTRAAMGTGLGLAITKRLVDLMQGTIDIETELNKGTTFTVTLPVKPLTETHFEDGPSGRQISA